MADVPAAVNSEVKIPLGQTEDKILRGYQNSAQNREKRRKLMTYRQLRKSGTPHSRAMELTPKHSRNVATPEDMIDLAKTRERLAKAKAA